jgi:hypothetical protein
LTVMTGSVLAGSIMPSYGLGTLLGLGLIVAALESLPKQRSHVIDPQR